jgi:hypothetical protein
LVRPHAFPTPSRAVTTPDDAPLEAYLALLDRRGFDRDVLDPYDRRPLALIGRIRVRKDRCQTQLIF